MNKKNLYIIFFIGIIILLSLFFYAKFLSPNFQSNINIVNDIFRVVNLDKEDEKNYPMHKDITSTVFWVGEDATEENKFIDNHASAWDSSWEESFGGVDDPEKRDGFWPQGFKPKENTFYIALPYNDFTADGKRKDEAQKVVYWSDEKDWAERESMLKNKWVKIMKNGKEAYAQWEDVGPFEEDDIEYVFGAGSPKSEINEYAGIDVSPAVRDYLGLEGIDKVNWVFIEEEDVPEGPWKEIVTTSQINWN